MTETRQGEAERGYSMTLSRIFDPRDRGLLLAVCLDADGKPLAFNQYVPAPQVNGYSLDLMRRTSREDVPSGLTDFVILETIQWMAERDLRGLGLNFATMRADRGRRDDRRGLDFARSAMFSTDSATPCRSSRCGSSTRSTNPDGIRATR